MSANVLYEFTVPNRPSVGRPSLRLAKVIDLPVRQRSQREKEKDEINAAAINKGQIWIAAEVRKVKRSNKSDRDLARDLGRTVDGVMAVRAKINFAKRIPQ